MLKFVDAMGSILAPILCTFEAVIRLFNHHIYRSILSPGSWGQAIFHSRQEDGQGLRVWEDEVFHHVQVLGCSPCVKTVHILALVDYIPTYLPTHPPTYLPTYQPTYLSTYQPTYLCIYNLSTSTVWVKAGNIHCWVRELCMAGLQFNKTGLNQQREYVVFVFLYVVKQPNPNF